MNYKNGILKEGECYYNDWCCFETTTNHSIIKSIGEGSIYNDRIAVCDVDVCRIHIDFFNKRVLGIHDKDYDDNRYFDEKGLELWKSKIFYEIRGHEVINGNEARYASDHEYGARLGGKNCHLLRIYSWSMAIPILINLFFSSVIFYTDLKSGESTKYESLFLILLLYPQLRTFKILVKYFFHKSEEELADQLDENEKQVSFIEPFCESGLQVSQLFVFISKYSKRV